MNACVYFGLLVYVCLCFCVVVAWILFPFSIFVCIQQKITFDHYKNKTKSNRFVVGSKSHKCIRLCDTHIVREIIYRFIYFWSIWPLRRENILGNFHFPMPVPLCQCFNFGWCVCVFFFFRFLFVHKRVAEIHRIRWIRFNLHSFCIQSICITNRSCWFCILLLWRHFFCVRWTKISLCVSRVFYGICFVLMCKQLVICFTWFVGIHSDKMTNDFKRFRIHLSRTT